MTSRRDQQDRILAVLQDADGRWVPLPLIMDPNGEGVIAQYGARIFALRHQQGWQIENKTKTVDGQRHSWYRLRMAGQAEMFT